MKIQTGAVAAILSAVVVTAGSGQSARATAVFNDNLTSSSSTVGATSTPSGGTTTSYDIASAKNSSATTALTTSGLALNLPVSSSAIVEAQALFTTAPIVLTNVGDNIDLTVTFTDKAGTPIAAYFGLYNSGGVAPLLDLANTGLSSAVTTDATGGAQNYVGYNANVQNNTSTSSKIQTRPAQTGTTNTNQDLISAGASGNQSYTGAVPLGSSTATTTAAIATGNTYTEDFLITVTAAAAPGVPIQYSLASNLYSGTTATGTALVTTKGTDPNTATPPVALGYNSFDAFAFGYRENNSVLTEMDYSAVTVSTNVVTQALLLGDTNGDGHVDLTDLNAVLNHLGTTDSSRADGNFDGTATIDLTDLNDVLNNLGVSAPAAAVTTPEPASLSLLAASALLLTRRRR